MMYQKYLPDCMSCTLFIKTIRNSSTYQKLEWGDLPYFQDKYINLPELQNISQYKNLLENIKNLSDRDKILASYYLVNNRQYHASMWDHKDICY